MKILVTGGSGFVGSHLVKHLVENGDTVYVIDNSYCSSIKNLDDVIRDIRFFNRDIRFSGELNLSVKFDQIYHLACPASPVHYQKDPIYTMETAFIGSQNVFDYASINGSRVLITSTSEVYGDPEVHPQKESYHGRVNTLGPRSCYDEGKRAAESLAWCYHDIHKTDIRIARLFNTYGPKMDMEDGRMIPNFTMQAIHGNDMTVYGDGLQTRSVCYVSDTVRALHGLMNSDKVKPVEAVNIGNPDERTVLDIAKYINEFYGNKSKILNLKPLQDDPKQRCPNVSLINELIGWSPQVSYEEGMRQTLDWFSLKAFESRNKT